MVAGIICALGFIGNTVSFIVLSKDKEAPVAAFLLQTLAFVDNFFLSVWFLHFSLSDSFTYMQIHATFHVSWLYVRVYTYPLLFIGQTGTIWMIVLIAVSRYVAVCSPYRAVQYTNVVTLQKSVAIVLSFSVLYNIPRFFETTIEHNENINGTVYYTLRRTNFGNTRTYGVLYFDSLYYIFSFILPLITLTFLNTKLTLAYRRVQRRRNSMQIRQDHHDHNITLVMIVVILVFVLCNAPARVVQIVWGYRPQTCMSTEFLMIEISNVLEVLNSSTNFVIYCVFRTQFRHILQNRFCNTRQPAEIAITVCSPNDALTESYITNAVTASTALTSKVHHEQDNDNEKETAFDNTV